MSPWKNDNSKTCLANLKEGVDAAVFEISDKEHRRLQEMGLVQGTPVKVITSGENMVVKVGDQSLCLPKVQADKVGVVPF